MSNDRQEIAEKIRDGSYFTDAANWYAGKYLYPVTERSMMFAFTVASLLALIPITSLLHTTIKTNNRIPFPIYVTDSTNHFSVIKSLAKKDESAQTAIARYLIADYIKSREEYIYKNINGEKLKKLLKKIKSSSAKPVLNEYVSYMNESNPYSPLTRYKDRTNRFIDIKSISFLDNDQTSGKAKVVFEATESSNDEKKQVSLWEVTLNFRLPDVATIARTGAPLRFLVGYYRAKPLDNGIRKDIKPAENTDTKKTTKENEIQAPPNQEKQGP
jgi:type IV secretion system protein VirB8